MFFSKKPKKLDSKVRYQHKSFSSQVKAASQYKRQAKPVSDSRFRQLAHELGLDSVKRVLLMLLIIAAAVYVTYVPNLLFIKNIEVTGATEDINAQVRESVQRYFAQKGSFFPNRNSLFLNTEKLAVYLKNENFLVSSIDEIEKEYSGHLTVRISQKYEAFTVVTNHGAYVAYNDGVIKERISDSAPIKGLGVRLPTDTYLDNQANYFDPPFSLALVNIRKYFPVDIGMKLDSVLVTVPVPQRVLAEQYPPAEEEVVVEDEKKPKPEETEELAPLPPPPVIELSRDNLYQPEEFRIVATVGDSGPSFSIIVATVSDMQEVMLRLDQLYRQLRPDQRAGLVYIDLRYKQRGYVCLQNTRCARDFLNIIEKPVEEAPADPTSQETKPSPQ